MREDGATYRMWMQLRSPYYICNAVFLLMYMPIRYHHTGEALLQREKFLNLTLLPPNTRMQMLWLDFRPLRRAVV
ncbi:hypothetical protein Plhal304r1_c011g0042061 [Plasmopara halstedii]